MAAAEALLRQNGQPPFAVMLNPEKGLYGLGITDGPTIVMSDVIVEALIAGLTEARERYLEYRREQKENGPGGVSPPGP